ncbi:hypothetical protein LTR56_005990 [Elasticomyces elasticus]|nr:hypothetical protein LTR56_005990 [Elasticomyces elasticus]KAK3669050.1 hypothetical protein LTR22_000129 [Elasticomyces elasticus]KAK4922652.1 hypothetical protein LTR49_010008 [Elasticomyces elasticus]KAK5760907.1 hypothetical protein LTS12_008911 [Elasticomyces elasticus]
MSGPNDFYQPPGGPPPHHSSGNMQSNNAFNQQQHNEAEQNPWGDSSTNQQQQQPNYGGGQSDDSSYQSYAPPPGPPPAVHQLTGNEWDDAPPGHLPPGHTQPGGYSSPPPSGQSHQQPYSSSGQDQAQQYAPGLPTRNPRRSATFKESDFVPTEERGEQREMLEHFEMSKGSESQEDRDIATLQREFPALDGSLVAALYSDSGSLGGTREMLREIGGGS